MIYDFRTRRKDLGLTLQQVAGALGVHPATIHHWEKGTRGCGLRSATRYRELLDELEQDIWQQLQEEEAKCTPST